MADFSQIIQEINTNLPDNNTQSITAAKLRTTLIDLTDAIEENENTFESNIGDYIAETSKFATNQLVSETSIINDFSGGVNNVASAEEVKTLHDVLYGEIQYQDVELTLQDAKCYKTDGTYEHINVNTTAASLYKCARITCNPGDKFKIFGLGGNNTLFLYTFSDDTEVSSQYTIKSRSNANANTRTGGLEITAPEGAKLLSINFKEYNAETDKLQKLTQVNGVVTEIVFKNSNNIKPSDVAIINGLESDSSTDVLSANQGRVLNLKTEENKALITELNSNPGINYVKEDVFKTVYVFDDENQSEAILVEPIILSQNGDSIEFKVSNVSYSNANGQYAFLVRDTQSVGISLDTNGKMLIRDINNTWIVKTTDNFIPGLNKLIKISYENNVINIYVEGELVKTVSSQATIRINRIGHSGLYGYYSCNLSEFKVNGISYNLETKCSNWDTSNIGINLEGSFLMPAEKEQLNNSLPAMLFEKTAERCIVYIKSDDSNKYIGYPLNYRYRTFTAEQYPSYFDNWGIGRVGVYEYDGASMNFIDYLFMAGEAELAINVSEVGQTNQNYVGGSAHGFENITSQSGIRDIIMLVDNVGISENSVVPIKPISSFYVIQGSEICMAYTNSNPFARVIKIWSFTNEGLQITDKVTFYRQVNIHQCQMGMMCVYRHYDGNTSNNYLTNKAIKDSEPFKVYTVEDNWESGDTNQGLKTWDHECAKITEYGQYGYGFSLGYKDATLKPNGGMKVGTNSNAYNKIYFDLTRTYEPIADETLEATQVWNIFKMKLDE